jgi:hypothetical protein
MINTFNNAEVRKNPEKQPTLVSGKKTCWKSQLMFFALVTLLPSCDQNTRAPATAPSANADFHSDVPHISEIEAKHHVGQYVVVTGMVQGYYGNRDTTNVYLYFDPDINHPTLAILWPGTNNPPVLSLKSLILNAKTISVSGKIVLESNVPEIIIDSHDQIQIH